jgi:tRNA dimethylallyltransferase
MPPTEHPPILIAGATASGKSALALALAQRFNGVVINADSMQVYTELPILTAQPSAEDRAGAPHWLYGHVPAREAYSTGKYLADVQRALADAAAQGLRPIIVGGTGLYFKTLLEGLSPVPPIPEEIRTRVRATADDLVRRFDRYALWQRLMVVDPAMAARLGVNDTQRIVRALEVMEATGRSLNEWQFVPGTPLIDATSAMKLVIDRPREDLHARCDQRFDLMMAAGALDEVAALAGQSLSTELPAMRALGVAPLLAHLAGDLSRDAAVAQGKLETRQYVKRQQTWLKRNMIAWKQITTQQTEYTPTFLDTIVLD